MKKKILSIILVVIMVAAFAGCSGGDTSGAAGSTAPAGTDEAVDSTEPVATDDSGGTDEGAAPVASNSEFDEYTRPRVVEAPKVAYLVRTIENDSQARMYQQAQVEAAHRGWSLVEIIYETDTNFQEAFRNAVNQDVDSIVLCSQQNMEAQGELIQLAREKGIGVYSNCNYIVEGVISNVM